MNYEYLNEQMGDLKDENDVDTLASNCNEKNQAAEDVDTPNKLKLNTNTLPRTPTPFKNALHEFSKKRGET